MRVAASLAILLCAVQGCASRGSEAAERLSDSAGRRDSVAAVAASSMSESNVLALLDETHAADSAVGALGAAKGSTMATKEFGRMILREHHALRRHISDLSRQLDIAPETPRVPPDEAPRAQLEMLMRATESAGWDQAYIAYAISAHEAALENSARALAATQRSEIRQVIEKSVPILQKHIDKAKRLLRR